MPGLPRRMGDRHCLVVWKDGAPTRWPLPAEGQITIGREAPAEILIDTPTVSRRHARLRVSGSSVWIEDLASHNATRVNGELLAGEQALGYGDVIVLGDVLAVLEEQANAEHAFDDDLPPEGLVLELGERTVLVADPVMLHVYTQLRRLAQSHLAVLIVGETGTGKDLAASALHAWSKRHGGQFVSINCAALPEALAESELFGHERGAFSGAVRDKLGLFESANGGTVFLDEIGDLPPAIQAKLLRVLESQRVTRLGAVRERPIDVRVVTATHRDLAVDVKAGRFRQDLYYRLSAAMVQVPPLRARSREISILAHRFLAEACERLDRPRMTLTTGAAERLGTHDWPGNVRELKNLMEVLAALVDGPIMAEHITAALAKSAGGAPASAPGEPPPQDLRAAKDELERRSIEAALDSSAGNKTQAAKLLNMPLRTFMWKLKRLANRAKEP
jgi:two-component system response regulator AtoC